MEMEQHFDKLYKQIDTLAIQVKSIDVALIGDRQRGVTGLVEKVNTLEDVFVKHSESDKTEFTEIKQIKNWVVGGFFVASGVVSTVVFLVNLYFKK